MLLALKSRTFARAFSAKNNQVSDRRESLWGDRRRPKEVLWGDRRKSYGRPKGCCAGTLVRVFLPLFITLTVVFMIPASSLDDWLDLIPEGYEGDALTDTEALCDEV